MMTIVLHEASIHYNLIYGCFSVLQSVSVLDEGFALNRRRVRSQILHATNLPAFSLVQLN